MKKHRIFFANRQLQKSIGKIVGVMAFCAYAISANAQSAHNDNATYDKYINPFEQRLAISSDDGNGRFVEFSLNGQALEQHTQYICIDAQGVRYESEYVKADVVISHSGDTYRLFIPKRENIILKYRVRLFEASGKLVKTDDFGNSAYFELSELPASVKIAENGSGIFELLWKTDAFIEADLGGKFKAHTLRYAPPAAAMFSAGDANDDDPTVIHRRKFDAISAEDANSNYIPVVETITVGKDMFQMFLPIDFLVGQNEFLHYKWLTLDALINHGKDFVQVPTVYHTPLDEIEDGNEWIFPSLNAKGINVAVTPHTNAGTGEIRFSLEYDSNITIMIFNSLGQEIARPTETERLTSGSYTLGFYLPLVTAGVYYVTLQTEKSAVTTQMRIIR